MRVLQARVSLLALSIFAGFMWYGFSDPQSPEALMPRLWPVWMAVITVSLFVFAVRIESDRAYLASGALTTSFCLFRVFAVLANQADGLYAGGQRFWLVLGLYLFIGCLATLCWLFALGPIHSWARQKRGS